MAVGGLLVGVGAEMRVGLAVGSVDGRAVGVGVEPHAARPTNAIAAPMMGMSFTSAFGQSTRTRHPQLRLTLHLARQTFHPIGRWVGRTLSQR